MVIRFFTMVYRHSHFVLQSSFYYSYNRSLHSILVLFLFGLHDLYFLFKLNPNGHRRHKPQRADLVRYALRQSFLKTIICFSFYKELYSVGCKSCNSSPEINNGRYGSDGLAEDVCTVNVSVAEQ